MSDESLAAAKRDADRAAILREESAQEELERLRCGDPLRTTVLLFAGWVLGVVTWAVIGKIAGWW